MTATPSAHRRAMATNYISVGRAVHDPKRSAAMDLLR
jgi:hypothetical protein